MSGPKLSYFNINFGRAEGARLAFHIAGVPFVDDRVDSKNFGALKPTLPLGQLPVLEVEGEVFPQSLAILRYVGKLTGLYPTDPLAALRVDSLIDTLEDLNTILGRSARLEPAAKKAARELVAAEDLPRFMRIAEETLAKNGTGFLVGDSLTIADLQLLNGTRRLLNGFVDDVPASVLDPYTLVLEHTARLNAHPKIAEWYEAHK
eukprot:c5530_g1_i1.p1 GENE.c5530_g1_i1~~c5530_g1_i1.p1  ORF type:complete len:217 (+),score=43.90 c5530_g1_i1:38-652(+)